MGAKTDVIEALGRLLVEGRDSDKEEDEGIWGTS